jgi:hypothetical protein
MPLVAPLILPFAELAGITIAGLGMAAASKKVSDFISDNPEISTQILTTLVPGGVGLNALFKDKDAPSTKDIVLGELGKEKGNYSSPNAEEAYSSKRGRIIKALEEAGKIKKGPDKDYDSNKKYKDYKKFYEKADGGSIGIEVLFEEKKPRKNFNTGGTPYDAIATTQDFTNALDKVGAGTDLQKAVAIGEYGQNARRQNPFKNLGFLNTQRHFDNNQLLKNAVSRGELSSADYNRLGGFDVAQTMGAGNPVLGGIGNLIGSTGYNIVQSLKGNQSPFDIPGDVFRNVQGGTGLISDDLKTQYENIINSSTPTPNASTDRPTMADVAGPGTSNNLLSLFERYKDIQTPAGADPNNPDFVGETALGNIEKGVKGFLTSDRGLKYGKDIPLDINDIYSFIEAQRRSFSPDLSQNYQGGDLYHYLQDFYSYKYGNPRIELPSGNYGYYDEQGPDGPVSNERENIFKSYFNQPYKYGLKDGGRIGFANGGRGYSDYASPSSTTASQDFATQAVSGGQTDYDGGGGGNDQPITEIRPDFNYNINPFSINPRLNFKNIASIIYLQEFLDKKARGEDADLEADINYNAPFLQSGIGSLAYNTNRGFTAGLSGNLTPNLRGDVSFQDGQQNVNFNYNKGPFSADFTSGPEENNIQVGFKMPFADGGRIGYVGGGLATTQDFANALKSVSAGTTYQQQIQAKEYARNEASNLLSQAMRSADPNKGPGLQGIYDTFFRTTSSPGIRPKTFTPDSSGRMIMYSARDRDAILDSMANQMLNTTPYAAPKPTYRTVSPEAQALNMSQSTYEDIIRSGADPKQYYMDYQNRIMAGNPNLLKYGQVIGGPGMVIAGPGTAPGATPPTQAQMNQMMQNNPMGYMDFADLVKTYSADPYKGLQEEIKDMVDGRDTGYMGGQDYYDINVLGLDGRGIAEKYGLQYADGGLATLFSMKR